MSEENPTPEEKVARVTLSQEQLEKLPKWAQDHVKYIYDDLRRAYRDIDAINGMEETEYSAVLDFGRTVTQETRQKIRAPFGIDIQPKGFKRDLFNVRLIDNQLVIRAQAYPNRLISFMPSSNVINVVAIEDPEALRPTVHGKDPSL